MKSSRSGIVVHESTRKPKPKRYGKPGRPAKDAEPLPAEPVQRPVSFDLDEPEHEPAVYQPEPPPPVEVDATGIPVFVAPEQDADLVVSTHGAPILDARDLDETALHPIERRPERWEESWGKYITEAQLAELEHHIKAGISVESACIAAGLRPAQVRHWVTSWKAGKVGPRSAMYPFLSYVMAGVQQAEAQSEAFMLNAILSAAAGYDVAHFNKTAERIPYKGDWRAAQWYLAVKFPAVYQRVSPEVAERLRMGQGLDEDAKTQVFEALQSELTVVERRLTLTERVSRGAGSLPIEP